MTQKLLTAKQIWSKKRRSGKYARIIYKVLLKSYLIQSIFLGKEKFYLVFEGMYMQEFLERIWDWCKYFKDRLYEVCLKTFTPYDDTSFKKYELIHFGASAPIHTKISSVPIEGLLQTILEENGFKILAEYVTSVKSVYRITRI